MFPAYRSPFNICCKAGLVVLNSLNFCFSEKLLISSFILNEILARYSNICCRFFPFSTLNISFHFLLACRVSAERSAFKHMGFPLYVTCYFSLAAFNILSSCLVFFSLLRCVLGVSPWVYPIWDSLCFLDLIDYFLFHVEEFSTIISSKNFSYPFFFSSSSRTPIIGMLVHLMWS